MTLNVSDEPWFKPVAISTFVLVLLVLWAHVGGGIFMLAHGRHFEDATPLTLAQYWLYFGADSGIKRWIYISAGASLILLLAPGALFLLPSKRSLFGDARFATSREIRKAGLLGADGVVVGKYKGKFLMFGGSQHVMLTAPTRSGKGVGVVIPNLLTWAESTVVLDVKKENHAYTSKYRRVHGQPCYLFDPAPSGYRTHRWNPLTYVSDDPNFRIDDIQKIAGFFFPDLQGTDPIWTATPRSLFLGIVLMLFETPYKVRTMGQVLRETLTDGDGSRYFANIIMTRQQGAEAAGWSNDTARKRAVEDAQSVVSGEASKGPALARKLGEMAVLAFVSVAYRQELERFSEELVEKSETAPNVAALVAARSIDKDAAAVGRPLSATCVQSLNTYITIESDNTRSGILTSFRSRLELWLNPLIDAATSASDFDLRDVRRKRMSIYLGVTPDNLVRFAPLLNLFFQQLLDQNTRTLPEHDKTLKYKCLILADEFTAMGRVPCLAKGISYIAGYGLRMMPISQSPAQIVEVYEAQAAETFTQNHALQIVFPPKASDTKTARAISEFLGDQTVKGVSHSKSTKLMSSREQTQNESDQRRPLLLAQEITGLPTSKQFVVMEGLAPFMAQKIRFYRDEAFMSRLRSVSPTLRSMHGPFRRFPTEQELKDIAKTGELAAPVPRLDMEAHNAMTLKASFVCQVSSAPSRASEREADEPRAITASDMPNLGAFELEDFAVDFEPLARPLKGELDIDALNAYADRLCRQAGVAV
ncbi:type IV secretory system conjugative DNA transfer family protein (plasmid) [Sphaerotilaceae bacterium SBD11-9]